MSGPTLFKLGDTQITLAGSSFGIDNMTSIGTSIITSASSDNLTLSSGTSIFFDTADINRMIITPGGSVGIGTNDPDEKLEVAGSAVGDGARIGNAKVGVWAGGTAYAAFSHNDLKNDTDSYALLQDNEGNTLLNAATGKFIRLGIDNTIIGSLRVASNGNVGCYTTDPKRILHIKSTDGILGLLTEDSANHEVTAATIFGSVSNNSVLGPFVFGGGLPNTLGFYWKYTTSTYSYVSFNSTGTFSFTGQHRSYSGNPNIKTNDNLDNYAGLIVKSIGKYSTDNSYEEIAGVKINNAWPVIELTNSDNDKSVYGVITNISDNSIANDNVDTGFSNGLDGKIRINSVGEGAIWVCNKKGILENGDYITSTTVTGYGGKQGELSLHSYTVAKITCDCDFSLTKVVKKQIKLVDDPTGKVISFDSQGNIEYENILDPDGNIQMVYQYDTRFLEADGTLLVDEADYLARLAISEAVYIACFVGCTYHCG